MEENSTSEDHQHHHHQHRPKRLFVPARSVVPYPSLLHTPAPTPFKAPWPYSVSSFSSRSHGTTKSSVSFLFLILFSLRSLYSLLPFLQSAPSFSLFPFSFLVSLLSFLLSLVFNLFPSRRGRFRLQRQDQGIFFLSSLSPHHRTLLLVKSLLLAVVFLLRFQALRYCGAAAMILAELSGNAVARVLLERQRHNLSERSQNWSYRIRGFCVSSLGLLFLSLSWDRVDCFPFATSFVEKWGLRFHPRENCLRVWPMLLPFLSGFLGSCEKELVSWGSIKQIDRKRVRLISLFFTTVMLFIPALVSLMFFEGDDGTVSAWNLGWPLANIVVFGMLLSENYGDGKFTSSKEFEKEFLVSFFCTIVLELFYFPELSLWGLLLCGFLLYVAVRDLNFAYPDYQEIGVESSETFSTLFMKPICQILSERKSRKIALFLLINTCYMVVEFVAGFMSNSLGLISDACHMLFDCAALAIGLYASYISRLPANNQFNYGRGRFEVLSGYVNAVFLVLVGALIVLESFERILDPQEISTNSLLFVSIGGLVVNVVGLIFFHEEHHHAHGGSGCLHSHSHSHSHGDKHAYDGKQDEAIVASHGCHENSCISNSSHHDHHHHEFQKSHDSCDHQHQRRCDHSHEHHHHHWSHDHHHGHHGHGHNHHVDHNMQGIFLHVLADTMGSVGVVISTLLIKYKGWLVADPASSIFISILIISSVIPLLRNSAEILLQRVPRAHEQDIREAVRRVLSIKGVRGIQKLHIWSLTNTDAVGTLHLLVSSDADEASTKDQVSDLLQKAGVKDLTLQVECVD